MKIPKAIVTEHKIRDFKICKLFLDDEELTYKDIGSRFGITASRIEQILSANCVLINTAKDWEKTKRKRLLKRWIKKLGDSRKDPADLLEQLRKEDEGDKLIEVKTIVGVNVNGNGNGAIDRKLQEQLRTDFLKQLPE